MDQTRFDYFDQGFCLPDELPEELILPDGVGHYRFLIKQQVFLFLNNVYIPAQIMQRLLIRKGKRIVPAYKVWLLQAHTDYHYLVPIIGADYRGEELIVEEVFLSHARVNWK
jgi:hypothetical protein